jgi:hypothetical protein
MIGPLDVTETGNISGSGTVKTPMTRMRLCTVVLLAAGASAGLAQNSGTCAAAASFPARAGTTLTIESRSGEIDIVGSDKEGLRITCTVEDLDRAKDVHFQFEQTGDFGRLRLHGGMVNNLRVRIELPRRTNLRLRVPAGEVRVDQVSGDKDIVLSAGEITVSNVTGSEYRSVEATVDVGAVSASAFGVGKGGFFRSFTKDSPGGLYRLRAHLISGNVQLN